MNRCYPEASAHQVQRLRCLMSRLTQQSDARSDEVRNDADRVIQYPSSMLNDGRAAHDDDEGLYFSYSYLVLFHL